MAGISNEDWSFFREALEGNLSPTLIASTIFGVMRTAGYSLGDIEATACYVKSHVGIDKIIRD